MAEMGPVRKIDDRGRVVISRFRKTFNWPIGMEVEISAADGKVIVAKHSTACVFFVVSQLVCKSVNSIFALPALQSIKHSSMKSLICRWSEVNVVSFTHHQVECVPMEHADQKEDD